MPTFLFCLMEFQIYSECSLLRFIFNKKLVNCSNWKLFIKKVLVNYFQIHESQHVVTIEKLLSGWEQW